MSRNYLIGVGGSGSKCVEAMLHLCAAGLGPKDVTDLWVGMVDADDDNGNVDRTRRVLALYQEMRPLLVGPVASPLFRSNILTATKQPTWSPVPKAKHTLFDIFEHNLMKPDTALLMDCLYSKQSEQRLGLHGGFRGRPSIGAAVVLAQTLENSPFWNDIEQAIVGAGEGEEVRLFLVGSVFGGTGAAALPSLARKLRQRIGTNTRVKIGAALLLPYFRFPPPADPKTMAARSDAFLMQAQGALRYYSSLLRETHIFDNFYVVGWPELANLPVSAPDSLDQCNPPLMPEWLACLAALRYFSASTLPEERLFHIGMPEDSTIGWEDFPSIAADVDLGGQFGQLVRWAVAFHFIYGPNLDPRSLCISHPFYYRIVGNHNDHHLLTRLRAYAEHVLRWVATLCLPTGDLYKETSLFNIDIFADRQLLIKKDGMLSLLPTLDAGRLKNFPQLVRRYSGADLATILEALSFEELDNQGLNTFAHALFKQCKVRDFMPYASGALVPA